MPIYENLGQFNLGMFHGLSITNLPDGAATLMRNVRIKQNAHLGSRLGHKIFSKDVIKSGINTVPIDGLFEYNFGTTQKLIVVAGGKIYLYESTTGVFTDTAVTVTSGKRCHFVEFYDSIVITNGVDLPVRYNGSAWTNLTPPTPATESQVIFKFGTVYNGNLYMNDVNRPDRIWYCADYDLTSWPDTNYHLVPFSKYDDITAMGAINEDTGALIFSKHGIWNLVGRGQYNTAPFLYALGIGSVAHETLKINNGIPIWLDEDGFYTKGQNSMPERFRQLDSVFQTINMSRLTSAWAIQYKGQHDTGKQYWCALTLGDNSTINDYIFVYDYNSGGWYYYTNLPCKILVKGRDSNDRELIYSVSNDGWIYQLDIEVSDRNKAISAMVITRPFSFRQMLGEFSKKFIKNLNYLHVFYRSKYPGSFNFMVTSDFTGTTFPNGGTEKAVVIQGEGAAPAQYELDTVESTTHFLIPKNAQYLKIPTSIRGRDLQVRITCNDIAQDWDIFDIIAEGEVVGE